MSCSKCKSSKVPCGCEDTPLTTPPPCETGTEECPNPDPCPETFSAGCVVWTGQDLVCNTTVVAQAGDRMEDIIETMIALFCGPPAATPPIADINLLHPTPNDPPLAELAPEFVCVDRINCFEDLTISFGPGAPTGMLFQWTDIGGSPQVSPEAIMDHSLSCLQLHLDISGAQGNPGVHNFDILITGCNDTLLVPATVTLP